MVIVFHRGAEEGDDGVTFVFVERSLVFRRQDIGHGGQIFVQEFDELACASDFFGERRKALNVGKVGRDDGFFAAELRGDAVFDHFVNQFRRNVLLE